MTRSLADIDVITQDRHSFVANWSKLLEAGMKYKDTCNILDKKQLEKEKDFVSCLLAPLSGLPSFATSSDC